MTPENLATLRLNIFQDTQTLLTNVINYGCQNFAVTIISVTGGIALIGLGYKFVAHKYNNRYTFQMITDSSTKNNFSLLTPLIWRMKLRAPTFLSKEKLSNILALSDEQYETLAPIIMAAYKRDNSDLPSVLLYGPAQTGKTTFANLLAQHAGMQYLKIDAASMAPFIKNGLIVAELNKLFAYAGNSRAGTLIVIDDVDILCHDDVVRTTLLSLIQKRNKKKIMVVCTTDRIEKCSDIKDHFSLPPTYFPKPNAATTTKILEKSIIDLLPQKSQKLNSGPLALLMSQKDVIAPTLAHAGMTAPKIKALIDLVRQQPHKNGTPIDENALNALIRLQCQQASTHQPIPIVSMQ